MNPHEPVLYRLLDAEGVLLYVGITGRLRSRLRDHELTKHWWPRVALWTTEGPFSDRRSALARENEVHDVERPLYSLSSRQVQELAVKGWIANRAALEERCRIRHAQRNGLLFDLEVAS